MFISLNDTIATRRVSYWIYTVGDAIDAESSTMASQITQETRRDLQTHISSS